MPKPPANADDALEQVVAAVQASARYRAVAEPLIRRVASRELAKHRGLKDTIKATKNKLHQVAGAYIEEPRYAAWLAELQAVWSADGDASEREQARRDALLKVMARHASTRERLPILDQFYAQTLAGLGPIRSVIDVACGLNPLTLSWAPFADDVDYYACDIFADMMDFLGGYFALEQAHGRAGLRGTAALRDVIADPPTQRADLALILKAIPCLEQVDKSAGERILRACRADRMLISFPARSLGGRSKGMVENYEGRFHDLLAQSGVASGAQVQRFEFAMELAFLVSR